MSHLTSTQVNGTILCGRVTNALLRLGWNTPPTGETWMWDLTGLASLTSHELRKMLEPFLDPATVPDGPFTVICQSGPYSGAGTCTGTQVADAHGQSVSLSRSTGESDEDYLGRCLQAEPVS